MLGDSAAAASAVAAAAVMLLLGAVGLQQLFLGNMEFASGAPQASSVSVGKEGGNELGGRLLMLDFCLCWEVGLCIQQVGHEASRSWQCIRA